MLYSKQTAGAGTRRAPKANLMDQDFDSIYAFVRAVKAGTFSAAARELGVTPSAVTKKVAKLEQRLGVLLLQRTTRKFALTRIGREFYETCAEGLAALARAEDDIARARRTARGLLRVSVPQGFGRIHVAPLVPTLLARHPELHIALSFGRGPANFADTTLDIIVGSADPADTDLVVRKIMPFRRVTCATPDYLARHGAPRTRADLAGHNCLIFTDSDSVNDVWVYRKRGATERVRVSGNFQTDNLEAMNFAVMGGLGIAHMPTYIVGPALKSGALVEIFADDELGKSSACMNAYYARAKHRLPTVTAFVSCLAEHFRKAAA